MILDKRSEFADAVALNTGAAGSYQIGDIYDLGVAREVGAGQEIFLVINIQTTATSGGSATAQFNLITSVNSDLSAPTIMLSSQVLAVAAMITGVNVWIIRLPHEGVAYKRYIGIQQVTAVAAFTAGKIDAFLTLDVTKWKAYADAVN